MASQLGFWTPVESHCVVYPPPRLKKLVPTKCPKKKTVSGTRVSPPTGTFETSRGEVCLYRRVKEYSESFYVKEIWLSVRGMSHLARVLTLCLDSHLTLHSYKTQPL